MKEGKENSWKNWVIGVLVVVVLIMLFWKPGILLSPEDDEDESSESEFSEPVLCPEVKNTLTVNTRTYVCQYQGIDFRTHFLPATIGPDGEPSCPVSGSLSQIGSVDRPICLIGEDMIERPSCPPGCKKEGDIKVESKVSDSSNSCEVTATVSCVPEVLNDIQDSTYSSSFE